MKTATHHHDLDWIDRRALDRRGELIGVVVDVYGDPVSRRPAWLAISSGFFGIRIGVAPIEGVSLRGGDVVIAHSREVVTTAPPVDVLVTVDPDQQRRLVDHYSDPNHHHWRNPMTDIDRSPVSDLIGRTVVDPDCDKIGTVSDVYIDDETDQPEWLAVSTGLFGTKVSFVPIGDAAFVGDDLQVPFTKGVVKDAPRAEADGHLSSQEESELYAYYGRDSGMTGRAGDAATDVGTTTGRDTSGPMTDEAMTRSEEELDVSTSTREAGRARLRKWIETENVQMTVPIRREKARVVVEPITDANRDAALSGDDLATEEQEVTLSEEVVDVDKRVVPKERVRLETEVETDEVLVDEEVRKERIDTDADLDPNR